MGMSEKKLEKALNDLNEWAAARKATKVEDMGRWTATYAHGPVSSVEVVSFGVDPATVTIERGPLRGVYVRKDDLGITAGDYLAAKEDVRRIKAESHAEIKRLTHLCEQRKSAWARSVESLEKARDERDMARKALEYLQRQAVSFCNVLADAKDGMLVAEHKSRKG